MAIQKHFITTVRIAAIAEFGLLTSAMHNLTDEIRAIHKLGFDYVEVGIEEPEGTPNIPKKHWYTREGVSEAEKEYGFGATILEKVYCQE